MKSNLLQETAYTNSSGRGRGMWRFIDEFLHERCLSHLWTDHKKPIGFGTWASNQNYPSYVYDEKVIQNWTAALEAVKNGMSYKDAVTEFLNPSKSIRGGVPEIEYFSEVLEIISK